MRILAVKGERGMMTVFFFAVFSTVVTLPFLIIGYQPMTGMQLLWLLLAGVAATGGQFFITAAYRLAPAKEIAVFDYMQVFFAAILGYVFLQQVPETLSFIGYAIIIAAAVGQWAYHMYRARKEAASPTNGDLPSEADTPPDAPPAPPPDETKQE